MELIIVLTKTVPDEATGANLYEIVKNKLADHPEITIQGRVTSSLGLEEPPIE